MSSHINNVEYFSQHNNHELLIVRILPNSWLALPGKSSAIGDLVKF